MEHRLAANLAADVVGYSLLMEQDEAGTLAKHKDRRGEILAPLVAHHRGRIVKLMGDGVLVEYASAVNALDCAVELQKSMIAAAAGKGRRRIGHDQPAIQASRSKQDGSVRTSRARQLPLS
jgi:adenylate cyclase